jgi:hypothetical protein
MRRTLNLLFEAFILNTESSTRETRRQHSSFVYYITFAVVIKTRELMIGEQQNQTLNNLLSCDEATYDAAWQITRLN